MATNNPYTRKLERDLELVRQRRRAIKDTLARMARGEWISGNSEEQVVIRRNLEGTLRVTEVEWQRLHHELRRPLPLKGSIKLDVPRTTVRPAAAAAHKGAVRLDQVRRTAAAGVYLTRALGTK